jgi:gamma-glutamyltranspeptidase/glutathione hydrolase
VSVAVRGYTVYGMGPPSSGGIAVGQTLALLAGRPASSSPSSHVPPSPAAQAHRFVQALRLAFADRDRYVADADFVPVPTRGLLDPAYLASRAQALAWDEPLGAVAAGTPPGADPSGARAPGVDTEHVSTTHLTVVDAERNAVALTASVEQAFGSGMVVPGWGFLLNNELTDFDAQPSDAAGRAVSNRADGVRRARVTALDAPAAGSLPAAGTAPAARDAPAASTAPAAAGGKRPRSSMAPTLVFRDGRLALALGSPGGPGIIPYVALTLERVLDEGMALQAAIAAPLLVHGRGTTVLEPEWRPEVAAALRTLGHKVAVSRLGSGLHGIRVDADGRLHGGVDPRREGAADGY